MKVSESPCNMTESYSVKFVYKSCSYWYRDEKLFYCNSKCAHSSIEAFAKNTLSKHYETFEILSVTYQ